MADKYRAPTDTVLRGFNQPKRPSFSEENARLREENARLHEELEFQYRVAEELDKSLRWRVATSTMDP